MSRSLLFRATVGAGLSLCLLLAAVACQTDDEPKTSGRAGSGGSSGTAGGAAGSVTTQGGSSAGTATTAGSSGAAGAGGSTTGAGCETPGLTWKSARKTWYTSYPDPNSEECIKFNGCMWAGLF